MLKHVIMELFERNSCTKIATFLVKLDYIKFKNNKAELVFIGHTYDLYKSNNVSVILHCFNYLFWTSERKF